MFIVIFWLTSQHNMVLHVYLSYHQLILIIYAFSHPLVLIFFDVSPQPIQIISFSSPQLILISFSYLMNPLIQISFSYSLQLVEDKMVSLIIIIISGHQMLFLCKGSKTSNYQYNKVGHSF